MTTNQNEDSQAAKLQQLFSDITEHERDIDDANSENPIEIEYEIDVLNLPPRSEIHSNNKRTMKMTVNWPLIRFLIISIVLIGLLIGAYYIIDIESFFS